MESKMQGKDRFFIVIRGKARKGFSRGCIGRVEAETPKGELTGLLYSGSSSDSSPKSGGVVKKEDTYPLTRHQAQLLLFVSPSSKRLELLCNPQLFSAICELAQDDLVVVKHKMGHQPGLIRNLMMVGKKDSPGDLLMLGFEVEFVQDSDVTVSSKKPATLPLFSASDIVQVVPAYHLGIGSRWRNSLSEGLNSKAVSRVNSISTTGSLGHQARDVKRVTQSVTTDKCLSRTPVEVGSMVEVVSNTGVTVYGVVRWMGALAENKKNWAGIELDYEVKNCSNGTYGGQRYFTCEGSRALFVPVTMCSPDGRFLSSLSEKEVLQPKLPPAVTSSEETEDNVPPIPESEALALLVGKMKGIQGHFNSCYLDATLFSLFSSSRSLDSVDQEPADTEQSISCCLRKDIVNSLRRQGFVPAENVMKFRKQLGCDTFVTEEKDPEEFITVLLQRVLCMGPLLKLRSRNNTSQDAYTFQIILDKEQVTQTPTVQQLLDTSFMSCGVKFEEIPSCLIVQMPRFGKYKMFPRILPSTELDITDLLYNSPRECFLCGRLAEYECSECLQDRKLQPGTIKQFCSTCNTQVHTHPSRQSHSPKALVVPGEVQSDDPVPRHKMQLFAVLCIHTSHYVSFVKYGPGQRSWIFFDSMADRCGDDQSGYSIPEVRACPEVGDFLSQSEEGQQRADPSQAGELISRLLGDSYMCLYQSASMAPQINPQG